MINLFLRDLVVFVVIPDFLSIIFQSIAILTTLPLIFLATFVSDKLDKPRRN